MTLPSIDIPPIDSNVLIAAGTFLTALLGGLGTYLTTRSKSKQTNVESSNLLIEMALKLNKQEIETLRGINNDLRKELDLEKIDKLNLRKELSDALVKVNEILRELSNNQKELADNKEEIDILKLSLEAVQCELHAQKAKVKELLEKIEGD